nr:hypothetical protein BaRGS_022705 [Batillaria attramentaria]
MCPEMPGGASAVCEFVKGNAMANTLWPAFSLTQASITKDKLTETFEVSFKYLHMIGQFKDSLANQNECQLRPGLCPNVTACTKGLESVTMNIREMIPELSQPSPLPNATQCESN